MHTIELNMPSVFFLSFSLFLFAFLSHFFSAKWIKLPLIIWCLFFISNSVFFRSFAFSVLCREREFKTNRECAHITCVHVSKIVLLVWNSMLLLYLPVNILFTFRYNRVPINAFIRSFSVRVVLQMDFLFPRVFDTHSSSLSEHLAR